MIRIVSKGIINRYIIPFLSKAERGFVASVSLWEIVNAIFYEFRTGMQWRLLRNSSKNVFLIFSKAFSKLP